MRGWMILSLMGFVVGGCSAQGGVQPAGKAAAAVETPDGGNGLSPFDPVIAQGIGDLFQQVSDSRAPVGSGKHVDRPVFLKPHGCAQAEFTVLGGLPDAYRVGVFAQPGVKDAWVRISSDTARDTPDANNNTVGFAVKVLDIDGPKILPGEEQYHTHDFLLQDINVFFADTAQEFLDVTRAAFAGTDAAWFAAHPAQKQILDAMAKPVGNLTRVPFWSSTPYKFGDNAFAKYKLVPCDDTAVDEPVPSPATDPNYLQTRLVRDVKNAGLCMNFQVQLRTGDDMPLDRTTVEWSEPTDNNPFAPPPPPAVTSRTYSTSVSRAVTVATVTVEAGQDITANTQCEDFSFTAWHALEAHRPVGSINDARGIVYKRLADYRRTRNGVALGEPE